MSRGSQTATDSTDARQSPRLKLPAAYTLVRIRPRGESRYRWTGYIYDISASGMRFELDAALEPGLDVELRAMLPGAQQLTIEAQGQVIRQHDEPDERGPMRMGLKFGRFEHHADRTRLLDYIEQRSVAA